MGNETSKSIDIKKGGAAAAAAKYPPPAPKPKSSGSAMAASFSKKPTSPVSPGVPSSTAAAVSPVTSSLPRYVDSNSMVYVLPACASTPDGGAPCLSNHHHQNPNPNLPSSSSVGGMALTPVTPQPPSWMAMADMRNGAPATPVSPNRRFVTAAASMPIALPTYNTSNAMAGEELSCSSPVLHSYRQHSLSFSKREGGLASSPTSPGVGGGASFLSAAPSEGQLTMMTATTPSTPGVQVPAIHTKFLEITGHPLGLENYGNTCYCNSVIQLIYHCTPLRLRLLELHGVYQAKKGVGLEASTVLYHLCSLIAVMHKSNNRSKEKAMRERIATRDLLQCVRSNNMTFAHDTQQDAHEFAMFLINDIIETEQQIMADPSNIAFLSQQEPAMKSKGSSFSLWRHQKDRSITTNHQKTQKGYGGSSSGKGVANGTHSASSPSAAVAASKERQMSSSDALTPLQIILQGQFGSLTACLECGSVTAREELFMDLSLDTTQGSSLLRCLGHFGDPEYFYGTNKLRCDTCNRAVRAAKTIHVKQLPQYALMIHLKRFRYDMKRQTFTKKADHVALPMQMDVEEYLTDPDVVAESDAAAVPPGQAPDKIDLDDIRRKLHGVAHHKARFELTGFVAHIGEGPSSGHYFTCVRYGPQTWRRFDDEVVSTMSEREVQQYFGVPSDTADVITTTAYILLYERVA